MSEQHYTTAEMAEILKITPRQVHAVAAKIGATPVCASGPRDSWLWHAETLPAFCNRPKRGRPKGVKS